ncbi:MAG: hypothetical protein RDV48_23560 [Candidatus Eremiobacteraeota bacterium]|nr:hypothetical protein [Candidatus Eremiobacteraeota bacterium]
MEREELRNALEAVAAQITLGNKLYLSTKMHRLLSEGAIGEEGGLEKVLAAISGRIAEVEQLLVQYEQAPRMPGTEEVLGHFMTGFSLYHQGLTALIDCLKRDDLSPLPDAFASLHEGDLHVKETERLGKKYTEETDDELNFSI